MRENQHMAHHELLARSLAAAPDVWKLAGTVPVTRMNWEKGGMWIYRRQPHVAP
jgi:hypothetical protein